MRAKRTVSLLLKRICGRFFLLLFFFISPITLNLFAEEAPAEPESALEREERIKNDIEEGVEQRDHDMGRSCTGDDCPDSNPTEEPADEEVKLPDDLAETVKDFPEDQKADLTELQKQFPDKPVAQPETGEINYDFFNGLGSNNPFAPPSGTEKGKEIGAGNRPASCSEIPSSENQIIYLQPSLSNENGAVLFGGQSCPGVKRTPGGNLGFTQNNSPSGSLEGSAKVTPDGGSQGTSENYSRGAYGDNTNPDLRPLWLGSSGAIQIHSLSGLVENASVNGVSSKGCLVVNQNCMQAINNFMKGKSGVTFKIFNKENAGNMDLDGCIGGVNQL